MCVWLYDGCVRATWPEWLIDAITAGRVTVQSVTTETQRLAPAEGQPGAETGVRRLGVDYRVLEAP